MNDPHVVALVYTIKNRRAIHYRGEELLDDAEKDFSVHVKDEQVRFTMKAHYATAEEARAAVREYIERWEFDVALEKGPGKFSLKFVKPEIEDRNPPPGVIEFVGGEGTGEANPHIIRRRYPPPPCPDFTITPAVESMYKRWLDYDRDKKELGSRAYFYLTVIQKEANRDRKQSAIKQAARKYGIDSKVLSKIGCLCNNKGGSQARKGKGVEEEFTPQEKRFLEKAMMVIIRRAAEVTHDPNKSRDTIKLSDLPALV